MLAVILSILIGAVVILPIALICTKLIKEGEQAGIIQKGQGRDDE